MQFKAPASRFLGIALLLACTANAQAAAIAWSAPTFYDGSGRALNQAGIVVSAFSAYGSVTVNDGADGVAFAGFGSLAGKMSFSGYQALAQENAANYTSAENPDFALALGAFLFNGRQQIALNNLTVGATYSVQLFALDKRGGDISESMSYFVDGLGNASARFSLGSESYVIGSFVADAASQVVNVRSDSCRATDCLTQSRAYYNANAATNVNAVVLRQTADGTTAVPEPGTIPLAALALLGLGLARRRAKRP